MILISETGQKSGRIKVAVIDSGIDTQVSGLNGFVIHSTGFGIDKEGYIKENSTLPVRNLHGTAVALIIRHICCDAEFISLNVLDEKLSADGRVLAYALSQVFDYSPDIIHMSLGTIKKRYIFPFKKIVGEAKRLNIPLVAAAENTGRISYPAYLRGVIGVKADVFSNCMNYSYRRGFFYGPIGTEGINSIEEIPAISKSRGTSMAAAYISGHLAEILKKNKKLSHGEAREALKRNMFIGGDL